MAEREPLVVVRERAIAAPAESVWRVVSDPVVLARIDPRLRLKESTGEPGTVGSTYALSMRAGLWVRVTTRTVVTQAEPGVRLASEAHFRGRRLAEQRGEILPDGDGVILRWTVTQWPHPRARRVARRTVERELPAWLDAVEREAIAGGR